MRGSVVLLSLFVCVFALEACGKKGPPLPPLARIPNAPANPRAVRVGQDVYLSFVVPSANVSGQTPADVGAIDVFAYTGYVPPEGADPTLDAVRIGTYDVQPVLPAPPPPPEGAPAPPPPPLPPGFAQGATAVVRETLTPEAFVPTKAAGKTAEAPAVDAESEPEAEALPGPLVAPVDTAPLKRFYFVVARGPRGRFSAPSTIVSVPLEGATDPPSDVRIEYTETAMTVRWTSSPTAHAAAPAADPSLLPSRPLRPLPQPTTYHVFEVPRGGPPVVETYALAFPEPLSPQPVAAPELAVPGPVRFGVERCFVVRPVDVVAEAPVLGSASEPGCVTPVDTFPPAPPQRLAAIAGVDAISLIWEPNTEADLAGYLVLRGPAPGDTLQALTPTPIRETTFRDTTVKPGERYVYAVVAVDTANPQNVSGQSNRVEESSRAPR
jgi:hypothetical protein